jgi:hypothetical protein
MKKIIQLTESDLKRVIKKILNEGWRDDDDDDDTKVLKRKPHVMPNIDEFLNRVDVDNTDDGYTYKGITYEKVWYTDDNGLYKWVWDYSTSEDKKKDTM